MSCVVLDQQQKPGGQAGTSSKIENLVGFPDGITGAELTRLLREHALKFGAEMRLPFRVARIETQQNGTFTVVGDDHSKVTCSAVIIACGVQYRRLDVPGIEHYVGEAISYGSPMVYEPLWRNRRVGVVGGGNSAAQATLYLSQCRGCHVTLVVRGKELSDGMSDYLLPRFEQASNIDVLLESNTTAAHGHGGKFKGITVHGPQGDREVELDNLFVQIGATPHTAWLDTVVELDTRGFVYTDREIPEGKWPLNRAPLAYETSQPGIFVAGDVRLSDRKRITFAVSDGMNAATSAWNLIKERMATSIGKT